LQKRKKAHGAPIWLKLDETARTVGKICGTSDWIVYQKWVNRDAFSCADHFRSTLKADACRRRLALAKQCRVEV
jgi:hypothetical protein